jgi:hypothetical protein
VVYSNDYQLNKTHNNFYNQKVSDKKESYKLAKEIETVSDDYIKNSKKYSSKEDSLIEIKQSKTLEEPFDKINSIIKFDLTNSFDLMKNSTELNKKLAATNAGLDSQVLEIIGGLIGHEAAMFFERESAIMQKSLDDMKAEKMMHGGGIVHSGEIVELVNEGVFHRQEELGLIEERLVSSEENLKKIRKLNEKDVELRLIVTIQMLQDKEKKSTQKLLALENELRQSKEFSILEHNRHEEQIMSLLKIAGIFDLDSDPRDESSSYWIQPNHNAVRINVEDLEEQRSKIVALKSCLMRFSGQLSLEDKLKLLTTGIILV